ncbi:MAG: tetratricopeptide repeat protein [Chromatiales bacterium]|jgi:tetratricopeptide (TPR) repeat protein|nr:MAG: tetratricopeptide repeat protein [Chromatiales bacterium]
MEACIPAIIPDVNLAANCARYPTRLCFGLLPLLLSCWMLPAALAQPAAPDAGELLRTAELALEKRDLYGAAQAFTAAAEAVSDIAIAERASQLTFGLGFDALAERAVLRWTALAPDNALPRVLLGRLKLRRYAIDDAAADMLAALGPGEPRRDEVYLALASDLSDEDNAELVTRVLSRLTALDPLAPGLQQALGTAALRSGDYDLAIGAASTALLDDPDWQDPQLLMARAMAALGRDDEALAKIAALKAAGSGPLIDLEYARMLADAGKIAEAREALATLTTTYGERPEIERTLAFLDLATGDLDAAEQRFEALEDSGPGRLEAFYYRGQIAERRGDAEAARRLYVRVSSGPYLVPAQLASAGSLARSGAPDQALEELARFVRDYPAEAMDVLELRAQLLLSLERQDEALALYNEALRYKPAWLSVLLSRGALHEQQGQLREAVSDLKAAVEIAPGDALALNALGYILANRTGKTREAWRYVRRAYEIQPRSAAIQDSVGWALFRLGRLPEARSHLEEAVDRLPDPEIMSHLAEVNWKLGDRDAAIDLLFAAAVAWPDSRPVRDTAERLLD